MEGLASKEGNNYNYKYTSTYLELNCQWLFEILKIAISVMCIITLTLCSFINIESKTSSDKIDPIYKISTYYEYTVVIIILVMAFCIPLFYFTRTDIFLGTGAWQKILVIYNLLMFILVIPALVLREIFMEATGKPKTISNSKIFRFSNSHNFSSLT